jgi:hypothetical protein
MKLKTLQACEVFKQRTVVMDACRFEFSLELQIPPFFLCMQIDLVLREIEFSDYLRVDEFIFGI